MECGAADDKSRRVRTPITGQPAVRSGYQIKTAQACDALSPPDPLRIFAAKTVSGTLRAQATLLPVAHRDSGGCCVPRFAGMEVTLVLCTNSGNFSACGAIASKARRGNSPGFLHAAKQRAALLLITLWSYTNLPPGSVNKSTSARICNDPATWYKATDVCSGSILLKNSQSEFWAVRRAKFCSRQSDYGRFAAEIHPKPTSLGVHNSVEPPTGRATEFFNRIGRMRRLACFNDNPVTDCPGCRATRCSHASARRSGGARPRPFPAAIHAQ